MAERGGQSGARRCRTGALAFVLSGTWWILGCEPQAAPGSIAPSLPDASSLPSPDSQSSSALLPSRRSELRELEDARGRQLERTLTSLSGFSEAHVLLALPLPAPLLGDGKVSPGKASVLLTYVTEVAPLTDAEVRRLVAGAVQGIDESQISVLSRRVQVHAQAAQPDEELVAFGPLVVTRSSAPALRTLIAVAIGTAMTLLTVVIGLWLRLRRGHP